MSAVATAWVWANSRATGSKLLVLLAIADAASQEGENSWQSVSTLGRMARVSESTVHRALSELLAEGEITHTGTSAAGTRVYALSARLKGGVNLTPPPAEGGVTQDAEGVSPVTPEPTTNPTATGTGSSSLSGGSASERRGRMTDSWKPTVEAVTTAKQAYPKVNVDREATTFRAWHQTKPATDRTQAEWDSLFIAWCARKQDQWEQANPPSESDPWDPVTGMPRKPITTTE